MSTEVDLEQLAGAAGLKVDHVREVARRTLAEDLQWGPDITTRATIGVDQRGTADVVSRQHGTLAGLPVAIAVLHQLAADHNTELIIDVIAADGDRLQPGSLVLTVSGPLRTLLTAERSMLNLLGQLSGVATATAQWVDAIGDHQCSVRDTRKTVPGLRILQKYAVRCGGGVNHRMGLGDAALIKDNHVAAAGSIKAAFDAVRDSNPSIPLEIECDTLDQVRDALAAGADLILLDNMDTDQLRAAVKLAEPYQAKLEASGGLTLAGAAAVAATGVDYIAVGALTHSAPVLDLGFDLRA
ncbi:carboxylating nicotinate-nucleotide diphosphorylase [Microlunatus elymi]|uniref:Nicotinate-nucleotide pyrophosphorylase [carboxylating] n=1 Tax=Microlunatus elymi TaxID=2596828 RepID=A0A516Q3R0_9ACTN|nr:carboxylating nicotinate-nucleotide diphosphorylase [Microlunatus elymi]QDP98012.1 carboxylating nicotinate-nucleotide diphosphorylase [Microlunatus elymi]